LAREMSALPADAWIEHPQKYDGNIAVPLISPGGTINQDAAVAVAELEPGKELDYELTEGRSAWVHVVKGDVQVNGTSLQAGDAAALRQESKIHLQSGSTGNSEVLVFELVA